MGLLAEALLRPGGRGRKSITDTLELWREIYGGRTSASGKTVNIQTAVEVAAVLACLRVRANGLAQVPLKLMREASDGRTRVPARDHALYDVLAVRPNPWQTSFEYREMMSMHLDLCGNHYAFINRVGSGRGLRIAELIPFDPSAATVTRRDDYSLHYRFTMPNGNTQEFPAESIWHVRGPSWNGWMGLEAVRIAREAIGLSMAIEEQQARLQKNGVRASGVYSVEGILNAEQYKALRKWLEDNYGGVEHAGSPMVLDRSAKWLNTSMTGVDAQTLETRRFQVEEICRHFGVNPIMIFAESKNTTYASAEQMFLAHVVHTLAPTYMRIEQSIDRHLLSEQDRRDGLYACFIDSGLLRGSIDSQKDVILGYVNGGVMTPNEGRALLDLNPDPNPESNRLRVPANIAGKPAGDPAPAR